MTEDNAPVATETEKEAPKAEEAPAKPAEDKKPTPDGKKGDDTRERRPRRGGRRDRGPREPKEFEEAILQIDRVTRVVAGGRRLRFRISVVIGDQKGRVGFGIGKAAEVMVGIQKAVAQAKRNLINVSIFNGTIPHEVNEVYKSSRVLLFPAPEGKGVIAGGAVRKILELAGVKNVLSKVHGSRNKINVAQATLNALQLLANKPPYGTKVEEVAEETPAEETAPTKEIKEEEKKKAPAKKPIAKKTPAKKASAEKATPKKESKS